VSENGTAHVPVLLDRVLELLAPALDTPDAVLVTTRDRAQDVKRLIDRLRAAGRDDLL